MLQEFQLTRQRVLDFLHNARHFVTTTAKRLSGSHISSLGRWLVQISAGICASVCLFSCTESHTVLYIERLQARGSLQWQCLAALASSR